MKKLSRSFALLLAVLLSLSFCLTPVSATSTDDSIDLNCGSCVLVNLADDTILHGERNTEIIYPASTTKILTALVVLRHIEAGDLGLYDTVKVSKTFRKGLTADAASGGLQTGEKLSVEDLLYMLLLPSHCDAANVLGEVASGSLDAFADEMNAVAKEVGCTSSHFVNPSGLHDDDHYTTCNDLYYIAKAAYAYDTFRTIIATDYYTVPATNLHDARRLHNTNSLICDYRTTAYLNQYCKGGKTGTTFPAGRCLVSFAERNGATLCCVMMGCDYLINSDGSYRFLQFYESNRLYKWGFEGESTRCLVEQGTTQGIAPVSNGQEDSVSLIAAGSLSARVPNYLTTSSYTTDITLNDGIEAPISAGEKLGTLTVSKDNTVYGTVDLVAATDVEALPLLLKQFPSLAEQTSSPSFAVPIAAVLALTAAVTALVRYRHKKTSV